ncbi:MAG: hypothetical protein EBS94_16190, partial [Proteobacteria bacterium]|nr:hypothetical protein [Pseudomonadota bacterium]
LAQRGERVTLVEKEPTAGGLASGFQPAPDLPGGGPFLDRFYHHLFRSDTSIIALIEELGLSANVRWGSPVNSVLWGGKYWRPYTIPGLLGFSPLPFVDRIRMGAVLAFLKAWPKVDYFERHTAADWLRRMMGTRAFGVLWEPLLRAKFGRWRGSGRGSIAGAFPWDFSNPAFRTFTTRWFVKSVASGERSGLAPTWKARNRLPGAGGRLHSVMPTERAIPWFRTVWSRPFRSASPPA